MSNNLIRRLEEMSVELADARREVSRLRASEAAWTELFNRTSKVSASVRELQKSIVFLPIRREWVIDDLCVCVRLLRIAL